MLSKERGKVHLGALDSALITQSYTQFNLKDLPSGGQMWQLQTMQC